MGLKFYNNWYNHFCKCFLIGADTKCVDISGKESAIYNATGICMFEMYNTSGNSSSKYYVSSEKNHDVTRYQVPSQIEDITITASTTRNKVSSTSPVGVECNLSIILFNSSAEEKSVSSIQFVKRASISSSSSYAEFLIWAYYFDEDLVIPPNESKTVSITVSNKYFDVD